MGSPSRCRRAGTLASAAGPDDGRRSSGEPGPASSAGLPVAQLASFRLPAETGDFGSGAVERMGPEDVLVCLLEFGDAGGGHRACTRATGVPQLRGVELHPRVHAAHDRRAVRHPGLLHRRRAGLLRVRRARASPGHRTSRGRGERAAPERRDRRPPVGASAAIGSLLVVALRFVIIGGGPAGNTAATHAARLGAEVTMIEQDVIGGAAHLWDCIPSKAMIATGGALAAVGRTPEMGLTGAAATVDPDALKARIEAIEHKLEHGVRRAARQPGRAHPPRAPVGSTGPHDGRGRHHRRRRRGGGRRHAARHGQPAPPAGLGRRSTASGCSSTRDAYPPPTWPEHLVVIGSGVTGVEFVHMFSSLGSEVTLIVSRQQVLPQKDSGGGRRPRGRAAPPRRAPAQGRPRRRASTASTTASPCAATTAGRAAGSHALLAIGSVPEQRGPRRSTPPAWRSTTAATCRSTTPAAPTSRTSTRPATCPGSCRCRRWPPCRAAGSPST